MKKLILKTKELLAWYTRKSLKVKLFIILVLIVFSYLLYSQIFHSAKKTEYQTGQVTRGSIISTVTESGNVASTNITNIGSPTNGIISELYVKNGDKVSVGDKLFSVKSTATPQEQAAAYASYLVAQNSLNSAKSKINSLQSSLFQANQAFMNDRGISNPTDQQKTDPKYIEENATWLQAEADYNNQSGVIAAAQASYNNASLTYQQTQDAFITAPVDGTVANLSATVGSNVAASGVSYNGTLSGGNSSSASSSSSNSSSVLVLGNFSNLSIKAPVNEVDVSKIKPGQKATITVDAFPDKTFVGKVNSVDTIGTNSSGVVTYNAYITFVAPPPTIVPGMTASAVVQTDRRDDALMVPTSAVQTNSSGSYIRELKNGQLTQVPVEIGISSDTDTEITSGLSEGETIVTSVIVPTTTTTSQGASPFSALGGRGFGGGFGGGGGGGGTRTGGGGGAARTGN